MDYHITQFIPSFHVLFSDAAVDATWIVALMVYVMLIVVICSLALQSIMTLLGLRRIHFFRDLICDYDAETLRHQRSNIVTNAYSDFYCGELWYRFDQSLICYRDDYCLYHTTDLAAIFNRTTLTRLPKGLIQTTLGVLLAVFFLGIIGVNSVASQSLENNSHPGLVLSFWCVGAMLVYLPIGMALMATVNSDSKKLREIVEERYPKFNIFSAIVALSEDLMALSNSNLINNDPTNNSAIQNSNLSPESSEQHQTLSSSAQITLEDVKGFDWKSSIENYQHALTAITQQQITQAHETLEVKLDRFLNQVEQTLNYDESPLNNAQVTEFELGIEVDKELPSKSAIDDAITAVETEKNAETTDTYMGDKDADIEEDLPHRKTPTFVLSDSKSLEDSLQEPEFVSKPELVQERMSASKEKSIPETATKSISESAATSIPAGIKKPLPESVPEEILARSIRTQQHLDAPSAGQQAPTVSDDPNNSSYGNTLDRLLSLRKNKNAK